MSRQGMRDFLRELEASGDLHSVERQVDPQYEIGAVLALRDRGPTQLFKSVAGYPFQVVGNLMNTREKIARGLRAAPEDLEAACLAALRRRVPPELVEDAPVQEVVAGNRPDIGGLLPVPTWFEKEGGPYITAGVIVSKDPDTGRRNVSIARLRLEGGNRLMAGIAPSHHLSVLARHAKALGRPLEIAVAIGNHPAVLIASQMYVELGDDEYDIAGSLLGEPLRLVRCKTVDLEVPAEAEIVLEGVLHAGELIEEGPVSEFHGFYVRYGPGQAVTINTVTHRRDAIYQAILPGFAAEHCLLGAVAIGATVCQALKRVIPAVRRVLVTDGGMGRLHAVITMHKPKRGEGKRAVLLAMGQVNLLKFVVVIDDDLDPADWTQVEWALAARFRGDEDLIVLPGVKADRCDPLEQDQTVTKIGLVATTRPGDGDPGSRSELARPPSDVLERVRRHIDNY